MERASYFDLGGVGALLKHLYDNFMCLIMTVLNNNSLCYIPTQMSGRNRQLHAFPGWDIDRMSTDRVASGAVRFLAPVSRHIHEAAQVYLYASKAGNSLSDPIQIDQPDDHTTNDVPDGFLCSICLNVLAVPIVCVRD